MNNENVFFYNFFPEMKNLKINCEKYKEKWKLCCLPGRRRASVWTNAVINFSFHRKWFSDAIFRMKRAYTASVIGSCVRSPRCVYVLCCAVYAVCRDIRFVWMWNEKLRNVRARAALVCVCVWVIVNEFCGNPNACEFNQCVCEHPTTGNKIPNYCESE